MEGLKFSESEIRKIVEILNFEKLNGIMPVVTVDQYERVLMLAFMNKEALEKTLRTGMMHYWSRSRQRLWMKGEESGHYQYVLGVYADCDVDSLLFKVNQVGKACHTGKDTCFHNAIKEFQAGAGILKELEEVIAERISNPKEGSYTSSLASKGVREVAKKVGEEATEVAVAALSEGKDRTVYEVADLLYHLVLLLKMRGAGLEDVYSELRRRRGK
ncbi:MAG: bifunctional phosphoribosyl-AMP cyclohydrolase/phosphoribosyl-ATP diphosphatase HisIE [Candidatus Methanomethyliaceae archaeon]|nr:bifunctional phosphoribosyl-AMP cyclohydrolase/phosphoribosyl-ATP diphosphatase HisIE [Candidatus Methanomethyliaceae archaeon]